MSTSPAPDRGHGSPIYVLPSLITMGNMFCGYAAVVTAMRGDLLAAATFIGVAFVLDMLDGYVARLTKTTSAFGVELDSLADVISFGIAPAVLTFAWALSELGRMGWAAGFIYFSAAAMRLARFNTQASASGDKRYWVGMPSPAAAGVAATTVAMWPYALAGGPRAVLAVAIMVVPALLMVSTIRFRSTKAMLFGWGPPWLTSLTAAIGLALIGFETRITLLVLAYGYLCSPFVGMIVARVGPPASFSSEAPRPSERPGS